MWFSIFIFRQQLCWVMPLKQVYGLTFTTLFIQLRPNIKSNGLLAGRNIQKIKINHGLVMAGTPGIGKDTLLEGVKHTIGHWNFQEISPERLKDEFNPYIRSVILRISEARDLGDIDLFAMHEEDKNP